MDAQADRLSQIVCGDGGEFALAEGALLIARELHPELDVEACLDRLATLARGVERALPSDPGPGDVLFGLNEHLFQHEGFLPSARSGREPEGCLLDDILERRCGDRMGLAILYISVGRSLGLPMQGVAFPGPFLVRLALPAGDDWVIDPFAGGITLSREDLELLLLQAEGSERADHRRLEQALRPADNRQILIRLLNSLKLGFLRNERSADALWAVNRVLDLMPDHPPALRDRGHLLDALECPAAAAADYRRYLRLAPDDARGLEKVRSRLRELKRASVILH